MWAKFAFHITEFAFRTTKRIRQCTIWERQHKFKDDTRPDDVASGAWEEADPDVSSQPDETESQGESEGAKEPSEAELKKIRKYQQRKALRQAGLLEKRKSGARGRGSDAKHHQ